MRCIGLMTLIAACTGPSGSSVVDVPQTGSTADTGSAHTTPPAPTPSVVSGPVLQLTTPGAKVHHHATVAWGSEGWLVAWNAGREPSSEAWVQRYDAEGAPAGAPVEVGDLTDRANKPDVVWDGSGFSVGYDNGYGGVWTRRLSATGAPVGASELLQQSPLVVDAVDLAVQPDGSGVAIWTEAGGPGMGPDDGQIAWRTFDTAGLPMGPPRLAETSSRKTPDAAPLPGGGWVGVWARHFDHPVEPDELLFEVHGRLYRADGSTRSFRVDDLDDAWSSRPAVAAHPDGRLAVGWRDKTASDGQAAGAWLRLFDAEAAPLGSSVSPSGATDGDRVVVAWADPWVVVSWQQTDPSGVHGVFLTVHDGRSGAVLHGPVQLDEPGGTLDERPSIAVHPADGGGWSVVAVWETGAEESGDAGLAGRVLTLR